MGIEHLLSQYLPPPATVETASLIQALQPDAVLGGDRTAATLETAHPEDDGTLANANGILVEAWTPNGKRTWIVADSPEQAEFVQRMNPAPNLVCCEGCQHAIPTEAHPALVGCAEGVASGNPTLRWWKSDPHLCVAFSRTAGNPPSKATNPNHNQK